MNDLPQIFMDQISEAVETALTFPPHFRSLAYQGTREI